MKTGDTVEIKKKGLAVRMKEPRQVVSAPPVGTRGTVMKKQGQRYIVEFHNTTVEVSQNLLRHLTDLELLGEIGLLRAEQAEGG